MDIYYEKDADSKFLKGKKVAVIGYGSQGHAHACNMKDSGVDVCVGLKPGSQSTPKAEAAGLEVKTSLEAAKWADIIMILAPDEIHGILYKDIEEGITEGKYLAFAHGFSIHFGQVTPPGNVNVFMIAPKGPGHLVRSQFTEGSGVPCLLAIHNDFSEDTKDVALAYGDAIGGTRAGIFETSFREECETDLFGEQAVLCGGVTSLMKAGFETLVEAGYAPEMAYFECIHEMKLIVDLIYEDGIANMRYSISNTAKYGDVTRGPRIVTDETKAEMKRILAEIQSGSFAKEWMLENQVGRPTFNALLNKDVDHQVEKVGAKLRENMPWLKGNRLVDKKKN